MAQDVRWRRQQPVTYTGSGSKQIVQLSRGMLYRELRLRLTGQPTLTAANNTRANTGLGDEWGVIKRIDIVANASDVIRSFTGDDLWNLCRYWFGTNPRITPTLGDATTANPSFDSVLPIPFWQPRSAKAIDTLLDSRNLTDLRLEITWGNFTDVNSAATAWTTNPAVEISSYESFGIEGPFKLHRVFKIVNQPTSANSQLRIDIPVGPQYRGFIINTKNAAATADATGIISNFKLISGSTVFMDISEPVVWQMGHLSNDIDFEQFRDSTGAMVAPNSYRASTGSAERSWYYVDLVGDGYLTEAIDTFGYSEFYLELNVTGAATINVLPLQIVPLRA